MAKDSKLFKGFLNLTKCNVKELLKESEYNGEKSVGVWVNIWVDPEPSEKGNQVTVQLNPSKEMKQNKEKNIYVCYAKPNIQKSEEDFVPQSEDDTPTYTGGSDNLPF